MEITLIKTLAGHLKPAYDTDFEKLKKVSVNEPYVFKYSKPRNYKFHKKFFALLNMVYQNQEQYNNIDDLREDLTVEAGFYERRFDLHGVEVKKAKSISFAAMDDFEFSEFYNAFIDVIVKYFQFDRQDIIDNIEQYF